jgi:phosphohistidine swiveling domain-containing protein
MTPGEILVTTSTTPSLMLAVEKASGIMTDEGSMLRHAAIIGCEFDIPCIFGTDNATVLLRTGDTIDMSADEGGVKIVSRKQPVLPSLAVPTSLRSITAAWVPPHEGAEDGPLRAHRSNRPSGSS